MKPISKRRIPALDGLRGLAILMVTLIHFGLRLDARDPLQNAFRGVFVEFGWTGVDLFFVLSGFLITSILVDTRGAENYFSGFYARRALRIFPLYYVSLVVIFASLPRLHFRALFWHALYMQNWLLSFTVQPAQHFWSLAVEEQFYLVWPLIVYWRGTPLRVLYVAAGGIVLSCALRFAALGFGLPAYTNSLTRMDALLWGAACACLLRMPAWADRLKRCSKWLWLAPAPAFAILKWSPVIGHPDMPMVEHIGYPVISLSFAALLVSAIVTLESRSSLQWFLNSAAMRTLGKYSYAAYVWHGLVADLIYQAEARAFGRALPQPLNIPILIAAALVVSMASYVVVERPFLRLKDRFTPRFERELGRAPAVIEARGAGRANFWS